MDEDAPGRNENTVMPPVSSLIPMPVGYEMVVSHFCFTHVLAKL